MKDVYLFSGFLGSGKTSLLTDTIRQLKSKGLKPAVLMNELGKLPFDSQAVEEDIPLKEMLEGCICCTGSEKTEAQIQTLLAGEVFDVLIVETTGAAHPVEALDAIYSPLFAKELNVKGIVTVVDSKLWLDRQSLPPQVRSLFLEQIRHAHLLLANKIDLLSEAEQAKVTFELQSFNPTASIIQTSHGKCPFSLLEGLKGTLSRKNVYQARVGKELALSTRLITFSTAVDQSDFEDWLRTLPSTVYRMKGYIPIRGMKNPMLFQYSYGMVQWLPEFVKMDPTIVIIGEEIGDLQVPGSEQGYVDELLKAYQSLFPFRRSTISMETIEHLEASIRIELLDELTHPRVRKSTDEKLKTAYERIDQSDLNKDIKVELKQVYDKVYDSVNTF